MNYFISIFQRKEQISFAAKVLKESLIITIEKGLEEKVSTILSSLEFQVTTLNKITKENNK